MNAPVPPPPPATSLPDPAPGPRPPVRPPAQEGKGCMFYGCMAGVVLLAVILVTALVTSWWVHRTINAKALQPVTLSQSEETALSNKVEYLQEAREIRLSATETQAPGTPETAPAAADPDFERKPIVLTEREINALIAKNTDLGDKVRVQLRPDEILAQANIPIDPSAPFLGGKTIRAKVQLYVQLKEKMLDLRIRNVSIGGMPLPNAWLGGVIGKNLVEEDYFDDAAMKAFVEGIETFRIEEDQIYFMPAE